MIGINCVAMSSNAFLRGKNGRFDLILFPSFMKNIFSLLSAVVIDSSADSFTQTDYCGTSGIPPYSPREIGESRLESVNVFFRHGTRGDYRRNSCYRNGEQTVYKCGIDTIFSLDAKPSRLVKGYKGGCQIGQLLDYATVQMDRLGSYLGNTYPLLLEHPLYLRSTDIQRTLGSLDMLMAQMFESKDSKPFIITTDEFDYDSLDLSNRDCDRASKLDDFFKQSSALRNILESSEYSKCAEQWKKEIGTDFSISESGDCLFAPKCAQVPLPGNIIPSSDLFSCVFDLYNTVRQVKYSYQDADDWRQNGKEYCRLATGPFMRELFHEAEEEGKSGLWATHDDTLACMLSMLGLWDGIWPKYASFVVFERYQDGSVRVLRDGAQIGIFPDGYLDIVPRFIRDEQLYKKQCASSKQLDEDPPVLLAA
jgi:hypothetical protein